MIYTQAPLKKCHRFAVYAGRGTKAEETIANSMFQWEYKEIVMG